ncbi:ankyrin repeat domain-containing protein [Wolbachia endosymbiont (group A) of Cheilosia soror]|uniref:ankyrin repeat domain-containing protein n=1 Tax=Wolbachia endosymbiont (group A) of Cheilosia soror TaxID=2953995 RepID=UPI0021F8C705|nr:ankyrin repeat domain-containing protein [Wolbachia endosymbiont (group A) of Cheilosia soror]
MKIALNNNIKKNVDVSIEEVYGKRAPGQKEFNENSILECQDSLENLSLRGKKSDTTHHAMSSDQDFGREKSTGNSNSEESSNLLSNQVSPLPTVGDGNCFFHAVFGDVNSSDKYETDKAQAIRQEWHKFLSGFESLESESMPKKLKETLSLIFKEVFPEREGEHNSGRIYKKYLDEIVKQNYHIYVNEIGILASLANIKIELYIQGQSSHHIGPDEELLSGNYKRDDKIWGKRKQVEIHYEANHFSHVKSSVEQSPLKDIGSSPSRQSSTSHSKSPDLDGLGEVMYPVFYCKDFNEHDLGNDENPLRKKFNSIVKDLKEKNGTHQGRIKTMSGGDFPCLRAKLSSDGRLLFTRIKYNNEDAFVMLEVIPGHEYKKSKYNNSKFFRNGCKTTEIKVEVTEGEVIKKLSCTVKTKDLRENLQRGHWLGKFITFSAKQEEIVENAEGKYDLPLIVNGSAGSGKTSVALEKLRKIEEEFKKEEKCEGGEKKKILYITQSGSLVKESKKLYGYCDEAAGEIPQQIEFLSVHEFIERVTKEDRKRVEGKRPINRNAFFSWFNKKCEKGKLKEYKKDGNKIFEEFIAVIGGRGLLGEDGKDRYAKLGDRQSIFPRDKRGSIYSFFEEYKKFIEGSSEYYDTSLIAHEYVERVQANYDVVVVDEVQDLTKSTLGLILKSLKDESKNNFLLCGDVNQVIHPSFFSLSKLKDFLSKDGGYKKRKLQVCILEKNYRNSKQVIELANRILHLKNYCFASEDKTTVDEEEAFFMKSDTENTGNVGFIAKDKEQEIAEKVPKSVIWAVLVLDDESKEDARKLFDTPLVFNIHEAKGLEFENVILYKFTSHEAYNKIWNVACPDKGKKEIEDTIKEIRGSYDRKDVNTSRPKDKEDKSFEEHKFYMNALYVGVTRAIDNVYIVDDKKQCNLLKVIEPKEKGSVDIKKEESSPKEWRDMALKLIDEGNIEQAKGIATKLLNKKEYVQEIICALEAKRYRTEAQEISNELQFPLDKDKSEQTMRSSPESEIDIDNLSSQFSQECSMGSRAPTNKAEAKDNKEISNKKNRRRGRDEVVSASKERFEQEEELSKLKVSEGLKKIISRDQLGKFIEKTKQKPYNKEEMLNCVLDGNKFEIAKYLIEKKGANVNTRGNQGFFPLHAVAQNGHKDMVEFLLDYGADVNAKGPGDITPLYVAARKGQKDVVEFLLKKGATNTLDVNNFTPLHAAAENGHKDVVEVIIKRTGVDARNGFGDTPLHTAAQEGHENVVKFLLEEGAEVDAMNNQGANPLYMAAKNGHKGVVKLLLDHEADVNTKGSDNVAPLHFAAQNGHKDIVELLLKSKADVNIRGPDNIAPLHMAAKNGHKDVVEFLLKNGADVNAKAKEDWTPLAVAAQHQRSKMVNLLITDPNINVGCVEVELLENRENREKIRQKFAQDANLLQKVKKSAEEKDENKVDELLEEIKKLLELKSECGFKPSLNYSLDGKDEKTTINTAIEAGGKVLQLLYDYAEEYIGVGTEIFKQLKHAKEQQENSQPKSDFCDVSVSGRLTQQSL